MTRVRPEYVALAAELAFLREAFALPCTQTHRAEVSATLGSFECIDRYYDTEALAAARRALADEVVNVVAGSQPARDLPPELVDRLATLHRVFAAHHAVAGVAAHLARFVEITERARTTLSPRDYIAAVEEEGRLTAEMVLLLFDGDPPSPFADFFTRLGVVGNLVDKLCDVRADFAAGELALRPSAALYLRLATAFVRHASILFVQFPRRWTLLAWGARYFGPLVPTLRARSSSIRP
ncbi:MAG TPA: hypothetical protein VIV11_00565 [Kofleriaceae bacterium]